MNKLMEVERKIERGVVSAYKVIESGVVNGYKTIENGVVGGYKKIEDRFVEAFLTDDNETEADNNVRD